MSMKEVFDDQFKNHPSGDRLEQPLFINEEVVVEAIALVSGQLQQMDLLMDDSKAPSWTVGQSRAIVALPMNDCQSKGCSESIRKKKKNGLLAC